MKPPSPVGTTCASPLGRFVRLARAGCAHPAPRAALVIALLVSLGLPVAHAHPLSSVHVQREQVLTCIAQASQTFHLPSEWLLAIAVQESGLNPLALNRNRNGSWDVGVMQINSVHWRRLQQFDIRPEALLDPCTNVSVGAFLLREHIQAVGLNAQAIGRYHSANPVLASRYAGQVCARLKKVAPC